MYQSISMNLEEYTMAIENNDWKYFWRNIELALVNIDVFVEMG